MPYVNAVRRNWISEAEPWLAENVPRSVFWPIDSHLGFWDRLDDFISRLEYVLAGRLPPGPCVVDHGAEQHGLNCATEGEVAPLANRAAHDGDDVHGG